MDKQTSPRAGQFQPGNQAAVIHGTFSRDAIEQRRRLRAARDAEQVAPRRQVQN